MGEECEYLQNINKTNVFLDVEAKPTMDAKCLFSYHCVSDIHHQYQLQKSDKALIIGKMTRLLEYKPKTWKNTKGRENRQYYRHILNGPLHVHFGKYDFT